MPAAAGVAGHLRWLLPASAAEAARLGALRSHDEPFLALAKNPLPFVLFGDSHAGHYRDALDERFGQGAMLTFPSCLAAPGVSNKAASEADAAGCRAMPDRLAALIRERKLHTVIWAQLWARDLYAEGSDTPLPFDQGARRLEAGMRGLADRLPEGTRIILIGNVPTAQAGAPQLAGGWLRCRAYRNVACPTSFPAGQAQGVAINARLRALAMRDPRFTYVDPATALCRTGRCLIVQDGALNYWDQHHLTLAGARRVVATLPDLDRNLP